MDDSPTLSSFTPHLNCLGTASHPLQEEGFLLGRRRILLSLTLLLLGFGSSQLCGQTLRIGHWEQTTYYRHTFQAQQARSGIVRITAIGDYTLYFNGSEVESDRDWRTAEEVSVDLQTGANDIAVAVNHFEAVAGTGLIFSLQAGPQVAVSNFTDETSPWFWSDAAQVGTDWTTENVQNSWERVQAGTISRGQVQEGIFHPLAEVIAGYPNAVNLGSSSTGRIVLADQRGQNIALGLNATEVGVTDGRIGTPVWSLPQGLSALNRLVDITLPDLTRINRIRVITKPPDENETYAGNSLLGYSVQISEDQSRWIEMGGINDIEDFIFTEVLFDPVLARYVRIQVTQAEVGQDPAQVTEIQIYGVDFVSEGGYISPPLDFGDATVKNFGRVRWWADVPAATGLSLQFSTGDSPDTTDASWSAWSEEFEDSDIFVPSPEPRHYLRYRVNLRTEDLEVTPALDSLAIDFSAETIAARDARGSVVPNEVPMGMEIPFVYRAILELAEGDAVEKIRLHLPSFPTSVDSIQLLGQDIPVPQFPTGSEGLDAGGERVLRIMPGSVNDLDILFEPPLSSTDGTEIPFQILVHSALYTDTHEFRAALFSPGSENPQNIRENLVDGASWDVVVTDVVAKDLLNVRAHPRVFTPNGDGVNDFTVIEFTLTKVAAPRRVDVEIFDLSGRRVNRLNTERLVGGRYVHPLLNKEQARFVPGFWDGMDASGELVPPGIYLFTVKANLDNGDATAAGVVHLVY